MPSLKPVNATPLDMLAPELWCAAGTGLRTTQGPAARIFILHQYPVFRCGVMRVLEDQPLLQCVGWAQTLEEAVRSAPLTQPDIVLAEPGHGAAGLATVQSLHRALPQARLVVLDGGLHPSLPLDALSPDICLRLSRAASAGELVQALKAARAPSSASPAVTGERLQTRNAQDEVGADLTQRERNLLLLMARGMSNQDIGRQLGIAMPTVKFHVTNILSKLQVNNRTAAVLVALRHSLVAIN